MGRLIIPTLVAALVAVDTVLAQSISQTPKPNSVPVTADNFNRAESDMYFSEMAKGGGIGNLKHRRNLAGIDEPVIRPNRDTLYSSGVFDLDAGPVVITVPDVGNRFMSLIAIDQDHFVHGVFYGEGKYTFDKINIGTRYVMLGVRTLVDPSKPGDLEQVRALQDEIRVDQKRPGTFKVPNWDRVSQKKVRDALLVLGTTIPDTKRMFGSKDQVDPVRHLIGTAIGWGGNPEKDAVYLNVTPGKNDGATNYKLTVKDVPVDAFWSITVYNAEGRFQKNEYNAYSLNNLTAKKADDGSIRIQFGGCAGRIPNCLPITSGWNYTVRLYRPRPEILNGSWNFPKAEPVP